MNHQTTPSDSLSFCGNDSQTAPEACEGLVWTAMQSLLGELSAEEVAAWELQLANDEAACAALATATRLLMGLEELAGSALIQETPAVETTPSVVSVPARSVTAHPPRTFRQWKWNVAALAASVLVIVGWFSLSNDSGNLAQTTTLVQLWRDGHPVLREPVSSNELDVPEIARIAEFQDFADDSTETSEVPEWLLAAVSLEIDEASPGRPSDAWEEN